MRMLPYTRWAVVLAGGDGRRLRSLARLIAGDDRPKQFCHVFGTQSLLQDTLARLSANIASPATLCVVTRDHQCYYRSDLAALEERQIVEQPESRGTAAAVAYALRRIESTAAQPGVVGLFPSDHHFAQPLPMQHAVAEAYSAALRHPHHLFLVGAEATSPEVDYGWIEPGAPLTTSVAGITWFERVHRVQRFWEKPNLDVARALLGRRCLWNTFIVIGHAHAFDGVFEHAQPELWSHFAPLGRPDLGAAEAALAGEIYRDAPVVDFSRDVLQRAAERLAVVPLPNAGWTDLGRPARVMHVLRDVRTASASLQRVG
jgi:mannose-1-phosphate guanylyltransferase